MNIRRNLSLVVGLIITLVLIAAATFFLVRYAVRYYQVTRDLAAEQGRLDQLNRRSPFPNEENIRRLEENSAKLDSAFRKLVSELSRNQYEPPPIEPARFPQELRRMNERLRALAQTGGVTLPAAFAYGFDRYFKGELPRKDEVPRLLTQLNAVESVCRALFEAGIGEVAKIERQTFEQATASSPAGETGAMGSYVALREAVGSSRDGLSGEEGRDTSGLFAWERVAVEFVTKEAGLWAALNGLARLPAFVAVSSITVTNETPRPPLKTPAREGETPAGIVRGPVAPVAPMARMTPAEAEMGIPFGATGTGQKQPVTREERIVAGRDEVLRVRIQADVLRFLKTAQAEP